MKTVELVNLEFEGEVVERHNNVLLCWDQLSDFKGFSSDDMESMVDKFVGYSLLSQFGWTWDSIDSVYQGLAEVIAKFNISPEVARLMKSTLLLPAEWYSASDEGRYQTRSSSEAPDGPEGAAPPLFKVEASIMPGSLSGEQVNGGDAYEEEWYFSTESHSRPRQRTQ